MAFDQHEYEMGQWRSALLEDLYERLELRMDDAPDPEEIEDAYRARYAWWMTWDRVLQSGRQAPFVQQIGLFIPQALRKLTEAKTVLADPDSRTLYDVGQRRERESSWRRHLQEWIDLASEGGRLTPGARGRIAAKAAAHGIPTHIVVSMIETAPPPQPPPAPPPGSGNWSVADVRYYLEQQGCDFHDKTGSKGCLWVIGARDLTPVMETLKQRGAIFTFSRTGGQVTKRQPAWWWRP